MQPSAGEASILSTMFPPAKIASNSKLWLCGLLIAAAFQTWFFCRTVDKPWTDNADFNGAVWSQAAHNFLHAGLVETAGVPAPFHYGPLPIPSEQYYCHHPSFLAFMVTSAFFLFGEHEWTARLVPILYSTVSLFILWFIVKSCLGSKVATFAAAIFAALPMQLHWGQLVNFEPCTLTWILVGFLGLRYWERTGRRRWAGLMMLGFVLCTLTSWLGCFMVALLCVHFLIFDREKHGRIALMLLAFSLLFGGLFLLQISHVRPDAMRELADAFSLRFSHKINLHSFTFQEWMVRALNSWNKQIPFPFVVLALMGVVHCIRHGSESEGLRWLGWLCGSVFLMNAIYVVVFRNASYIHDYAFFYFVVPVAMMAGVGVERIGCWAGRAGEKLHYKWLHAWACAGVLLAMGTLGYSATGALDSQAHILDLNISEPERLIPELGKLIRSEFSPETAILCNVDIYFTPQLWYYSKRNLVSGLTKDVYWRDYIASHPQILGGVIWLGSPESKNILSILHLKPEKTILVEGVPFCVWKPSSPAATLKSF